MYSLVKVIGWLFISVILASAGAYAQTPGGVSSGLTSWFKANSPMTGNVDTAGSARVANWKSELGNLQVSQGTASRQPVLEVTNTTTGNFNFNPFLQFSKNNNTVLYNTSVTPDLTGSNGSVFVVMNTFNAETDGNPSGFTYKATNYAFQFKPGFRIQTGDGTAGGTGDYYNWSPWPSGVPNYSTTAGIILTGKGVDQSTTTSKFNARRNGDSIAVSHRYNLPNDGFSYTPIIPAGLFMGSDASGTGAQNMSCALAEVVTYNTYLSEADQNKVESYLAIKYGITLTTGMTTVNRNYTAADGTTIWQAAGNAGYSYNITGIGRDDNSGLFQKQSRSIHTNSLVYLYNGATGGNFPASNAANASAIDDNSFLLFGDNGLSKNINSCAGARARMERVWKVQKTGTGIATLTLAVDKDSVATAVKGIIVGTDPAFAAGTFTFYPLSLAGGKLYAAVSLTNNYWFTFSANDSIKIVTTAVAPICTDSLSGTITATVTGGIEPYSYLWSTGNNTDMLTGVKAGTYTLTVSNRCEVVTTSIVVLPPTAPLAPAAAGDTICVGDIAHLFVKNPNVAYTYNWYTTASGSTIEATGISYNISPAGLPTTYYVELQHGNCRSVRTPVVVMQPTPLTRPIVTAINISANAITFQWQPVPGANGYLVSVNGGVYITPTSGSLGTTHIIGSLQSKETLTIHVIALGDIPCQNSQGNATATTPADEIFIPNSFTPNGDGKNDLFKVYGNGLANMEMKIFNQWGELLYAGKDISTGWDGTHKGRRQPIGVYSYVIRLTLTDKSEVIKKGSVNLLK